MIFYRNQGSRSYTGDRTFSLSGGESRQIEKAGRVKFRLLKSAQVLLNIVYQNQCLWAPCEVWSFQIQFFGRTILYALQLWPPFFAERDSSDSCLIGCSPKASSAPNFMVAFLIQATIKSSTCYHTPRPFGQRNGLRKSGSGHCPIVEVFPNIAGHNVQEYRKFICRR